VIGLPHPIELGAELVARWGDVLADYEILQPFPQLGRDVFVPDEAQRGQPCVASAVGATVASPTFYGLERRGWLPREVGDGGMTAHFVKLLPGGHAFRIDIEPGIYAGDPGLEPIQTIRAACITAGPRSWMPGAPFSEIDPVAASEALADLAWLQSS
jgi:hypothetical protein